MEKFFKPLKFLSLAFLLVLGTACSNDDDNIGTDPDPDPTGETITDLAASNPDLSTLVAALQRTGLDATLADENGNFTVLAPTNQAFTDAGVTSLDAFSDEELRNILLNHVLENQFRSSDFTTQYYETLGQGPDQNALSLYVDTSSGITFNGVANPVADNFDVEASNGIIHVVNAVVLPPTIVTHAAANANFSTLVTALGRFGDTYTNALSGDGPFTVFAPTNAAFDELLATLGMTLEEIPDALLETVLTYHVIAGQNLSANNFVDGQTETTLQGSDLSVNVGTDGNVEVVDATGIPGDVVAADVQAVNGVIHAVNRVLLPQEVVDAVTAEATIGQLVNLNGDYSTLGLALERTGLDELVNDPNASLTVFAPDNDAFAAFLENAGLTFEEVPNDLLANILANHVLLQDEAVTSDMLSNTYANTRATNADGDNLSLYINVDNGVTLNGVSTVTMPDISTVNGVIHAVDVVIGLPTVVTFATADPTFESLVGALTTEGQPDFVSVLSDTEATFTVFAPTNAAFGELAAVPEGETLTAVLNHHVVGEANIRSADLTEGTNTVVSLEGDELDIILPPTQGGIANIVDGSGNTQSIIAVDVQAWNGVIHVIDGVLVPDTTN
ncbi:fasciclin domain-containing protein [Robertkochia aurantiaca]|uniref:fasciclin domain-containing protein n=1 Tax=Robertkochia aurantiaca TaxID=2873700 RepID=UPI001CCE42D9|nr:fasciclin domain-containing protein [Robertkochia sp. 3YJGBD-33]